jgi:hypothetical protein
LQQIYSITSSASANSLSGILMLDHAAARNSARRRAPDRGAVRVAFACGGRARPIPKPLRIAMKAKQDRAGT